MDSFKEECLWHLTLLLCSSIFLFLCVGYLSYVLLFLFVWLSQGAPTSNTLPEWIVFIIITLTVLYCTKFLFCLMRQSLVEFKVMIKQK